MHKYGLTEEDMARVTVKNRANASLNPKAHLRKKVTIEDVFASRYIAWPIKLLDACPQSSGGCAMVLASERYIKENRLEAVWITGVAHCSESYFMGDRMGNNYVADHADAHALGESFERSYRMAGIKDPESIDSPHNATAKQKSRSPAGVGEITYKNYLFRTDSSRHSSTAQK